jgi:AcrR family transcriptional regulator
MSEQGMAEKILSTHRREQIVATATDLFLRYGYARTTLADIARAIGLTRPTLYLSFPDKESVFEAVVSTMIDSKLRDIREGLRTRDSLRDQLQFACEAWAGDGFELVLAHPDAADMFDLGFGSVCAGYGEFEKLLTDILIQPANQSPLGIPAATIARSIVFALRGFKDTARDGADMRELIRVHAALVAGALDRTAG